MQGQGQRDNKRKGSSAEDSLISVLEAEFQRYTGMAQPHYSVSTNVGLMVVSGCGFSREVSPATLDHPESGGLSLGRLTTS